MKMKTRRKTFWTQFSKEELLDSDSEALIEEPWADEFLLDVLLLK